MISNLSSLESLISNESLRNFVSFVVLFAILIIALVALSRLLNIKVDSENPSLMAPAYERILRLLSALDVLINARNIVGLKK